MCHAARDLRILQPGALSSLRLCPSVLAQHRGVPDDLLPRYFAQGLKTLHQFRVIYLGLAFRQDHLYQEAPIDDQLTLHMRLC